MQKLFIVLTVLILFASCAWEGPYFVTFEEAISDIVAQYGEPAHVKNTYFYEDGTVRNRLVYWDIESYQVVVSYYRDIPTYAKTMHVEIWYQPDVDKYTRYRAYGWTILRENMGTYSIPID